MGLAKDDAVVERYGGDNCSDDEAVEDDDDDRPMEAERKKAVELRGVHFGHVARSEVEGPHGDVNRGDEGHDDEELHRVAADRRGSEAEVAHDTMKFRVPDLLAEPRENDDPRMPFLEEEEEGDLALCSNDGPLFLLERGQRQGTHQRNEAM